MQLLDVAKQCCYRSGDNVLNSLFSTDDNATAWQGYLQQAGKLIPREHNWQKLRREAIIITAGSTDKYDLPDDFLDMTTDKIYNITDNRYILSRGRDRIDSGDFAEHVGNMGRSLVTVACHKLFFCHIFIKNLD